jgi:hypothetical protein
MKRADILGWFTDICLGWIMLLVLITLTKLASDFLTTPNIFMKTEVMSQKQKDDMCVAWWFDSDLTAAKKRVCGK